MHPELHTITVYTILNISYTLSTQYMTRRRRQTARNKPNSIRGAALCLQERTR